MRLNFTTMKSLMNIKTKKRSFIFLLLALLSLSAYSDTDEFLRASGENINLRCIYNYSNQAWTLFFSITYGSIATDLRQDKPFKKNLQITIEPGQILPFYYQYFCSDFGCSIQGRVVISDVDKQAACYRIDTAGFFNESPYLEHKGVTGPVVLNGNTPDAWNYGSVMFIGDSWKSWSNSKDKDQPNSSFGSTCTP